MKKLIMSAAIALLAVSAFAQSGSRSIDRDKSAKETTLGGKEKGRVSVSDDLSKSKSENDYRQDDLNTEAKLSPEEKAARKTARKAEAQARKEDGKDIKRDDKLSPEEKAARKTARKLEGKTRKADRMDDGIENGSAGNNNDHGKNVSGVARGTTLEGREKGEAVGNVARSKARNGERVNPKGTNKKPNTVLRPAGSGKPSGAGRPMGAGRKGHK
jgi:hypothetical protein